MKLSELISASGARVDKIVGEADVLRPVADSRRVRPGDLFVCMPSGRTDTHALIADAKAAGASAAVLHGADGIEKAADLPYVLIDGGGAAFREALWRIAHSLFGNPTASMRVIGVTGTNGKTTTAWLLRDLMESIEGNAAYLGTLGYQDALGEVELNNTTPFAVELAELLATARDRGVKNLAMEVSSHALEERRSDGIHFRAGVFTNLTQDHLDYHGTMEAYAAAKLRLFSDLAGDGFQAALNLDDPVGRQWASQIRVPVVGFTLEEQGGESALSGSAETVQLDRLALTLRYKGAVARGVEVPLGGQFNVSNTMSAVAGALAAGFEFGRIVAALPSVHPVPGRFEAVKSDTGVGVIVDYAHTPDALEKLLDSVRGLSPKRIISVFGCGGDRDRTKRPKMAAAASSRSEITVATSDNPRTEDPQSILDEVLTGIVPGRDSVAIIDRREAIAHAVEIAEPGDVVVIAGKGHENYQIIGHTKVPMDDRDMAREALRLRR